MAIFAQARTANLMVMPHIETLRLYLRDFVPGDAPAMEAVFCDPEVMRYSDKGARPKGFASSWISGLDDRYNRNIGLGYWAVIERSTDCVIGYIGLSRNPARCASIEAEIGFRLARQHWGQGYATEIGSAMLSYSISTLHWPRIIAIIDPENGGSVRVAEKIGMVFERTIMFDSYDHPDHFYAISAPRSAAP